MPKKTKKQKLLAELHRKIETAVKTTSPNFVKSQNMLATETVATAVTPSFTYSKNAVIKPKTQKITADYAYVKHDLIRITIFVIMTAIFQGVLYFFLRNH